MKKFTNSIAALLTAGVILFSGSAKAQSFGVGTSVINLGVGLGYSEGYYDGLNGGSSTPVISGSYEYGVTKLGPGTLGLGLQVAYQGESYSSSSSYYDHSVYNPVTGYYGAGPYTATLTDKWTATLFGIRGVYHPDFCNGKNYDVYGVLQLSYDHVGYSSSTSTNDPYNNNYANGYYGSGGGGFFYPYIMIGGRYYFTDNIGVWAELGYSLAYFNLGLSIKFGGSSSK